MTNVLDALTAHYDRMRNQSYTVPGITGPDGGPLTIYFDPPTQAQSAQIRARAGHTDEAKISLYTVIYLAKTKDGARMFEDNAATVKALTENTVGTVLGRMAQAIFNCSTADDLGN